MNKSNWFFSELREHAVKMVQEHCADYPSLWAAIESIAPKLGCEPQTANEWVKRAALDACTRVGVTSSAARQVKELRRANGILMLASAFFAQSELERRLRS
jgi:transposase